MSTTRKAAAAKLNSESPPSSQDPATKAGSAAVSNDAATPSTPSTRSRLNSAQSAPTPSLRTDDSTSVDDIDETKSNVSDALKKEEKEIPISPKVPQKRGRKPLNRKNPSVPVTTRKSTAAKRLSLPAEILKPVRSTRGRQNSATTELPPKRKYQRKTVANVASEPAVSAAQNKRKRSDLNKSDGKDDAEEHKIIKAIKIEPENDKTEEKVKNEPEEVIAVEKSDDSKEEEKTEIEEVVKEAKQKELMKPPKLESSEITNDEGSGKNFSVESKMSGEYSELPPILQSEESDRKSQSEDKKSIDSKNVSKLVKKERPMRLRRRAHSACCQPSVTGKRSLSKNKDSPKEDQTKDLVCEEPDGTEIVEIAGETSLIESTNLAPKTAASSLRVDTIEQPSQAPETSSEGVEEKAASLSPDFVSEGVSVSSVEQFYKKPEFLENNLGIEKDPQLGEIVQKVEKTPQDDEVDPSEQSSASKEIPSETKAEGAITENVPDVEITVLDRNLSLESLPEGSLMIDDSNDAEGISVALPKQSTDPISELLKNLPNTFKPAETFSTNPELIPFTEIDFNVRGDEIKEDIDIKVDETVRMDDNSEVAALKSKIFDQSFAQDSTNLGESEKLKSDKAKLKGLELAEDLNEKTIKEIPIQAEIIDKQEICDETKAINKQEGENVQIIKDSDENIVLDSNKENIDEATGAAQFTEEDIELTLDMVKNPNETAETLKQKENHLKTLGLLTHKAAVEAENEKKRRRRELYTNLSSSDNKKNLQGNESCDSGSGENDPAASNEGSAAPPVSGAPGNTNSKAQEYTGTLKTVIKLNRQTTGTSPATSTGNSDGSNKKGNKTASSYPNDTGNGRMPLKMTFQKGRARGTNFDKDTSPNSGDEYYTIQNEVDGSLNETSPNVHGRKSYYRNHTSDSSHISDLPETIESKKDEKEVIVIPEKAASFKFHPGRLCRDQCYYCGGRFGLYDTPCHVAQIKSLDRQRKILESEEKLTVDNCLCDACFRHVDRRANCPSYKKRASLESNGVGMDNKNNDEGQQHQLAGQSSSGGSRGRSCKVPGCSNQGGHQIRVKHMRKNIRKMLHIDNRTQSLSGMVPICDSHYDIISQQMGCALCKRRLVKNHIFHITQDVRRLEKLLILQGLPVTLQDNAAVCKLCRYFTNLLMKPPDSKSQKAEFAKNYRRRLLHFHNIQSEANSDKDCSDADENGEQNEVDCADVVKPPPAKRGRKPKTQIIELDDSNQASIHDDSPTPQSSEDGNTSGPLQTSGGQIVLDNDVMVDYDVPLLDESPTPPPPPPPPATQSKLQTILQSGFSKKDDISIVLRSNPNISMRELFPGEEEMGLQVNVPFGNSSSFRTPEGWTRTQCTLQYDESTRRLWEDLQKPYGNQSSFLRHLILLEKYFRNGDLLLSPNATSTAAVYSDSVQQRLNSYDNIKTPNRKRNRGERSSLHNASANESITMTPTSASLSRPPTISELLQQSPSIAERFVNSPITITTRPKAVSTSTTNSQQNQKTVDTVAHIGLGSSLVASSSSATNSNSNTHGFANTNSGDSILKANLLGKNNSSIEILPISNTGNATITSNSSSNGANSAQVSTDNLTGSSVLTKQQKILAAASKLMNHDQRRKSDEEQHSAGSSRKNFPNLPPELISINNRGQNSLLIGKNKVRSYSQNIIKLPDTLSPHEKANGKNWRPTLMPISGGAHQHQSGPLYQTADGRKLPALVQVQSGGRPYLISIHDYNRMCILRREKLLREQMLKTKMHNRQQQQQQLLQQAQQRLQIPNKIMEQNSLIPVSGSSFSNANTSKRQSEIHSTSSRNHPQTNLIPIAPKTSQSQTPHVQILPHSIASTAFLNNPSSQLATTSTGGLISVIPSTVLNMPQTSGANTSTSWLWSNPAKSGPSNSSSPINGIPVLNTKHIQMNSSSTPNPMSILKSHHANFHVMGMVSNGGDLNSSNSSSPLILDGSFLSRIPKSLTVIPQQRPVSNNQQMSSSRKNSIEDYYTSA